MGVNIMGINPDIKKFMDSMNNEAIDAEVCEEPLMIAQHESVTQAKENMIYHTKVTVILLSVAAAYYLLYHQVNIYE